MIKSYVFFLFVIYSCFSNSGDRNSFDNNTVLYKEPERPPELTKARIKTDSSVIEIKYYEEFNSVREFNEIDSSRCFYTDYYISTKKIKEQGMFKDGHCSGTWKYYNEKGKIQKEINFDTGEKKLFNGKTEPYDSLFREIKSKADRFLINHFGSDFFFKNIKWDINQTYYFSTNGYGAWFDVPKEVPERFTFRYFLLYDNNYRISSIEFNLDSKGNIIEEKSNGLRKCISVPCAYSLNYSDALQIAKQNGIEPGTNPNHFYFEWNKSPDSHLGDYQLVILELKKKKQFNKRVSFYYYDGIILNPWTGKVIRKSDFMMMYSQTMYCSYTSGIIERQYKGILKEVFEMVYNQSLFAI